jgi:hypothetical protein
LLTIPTNFALIETEEELYTYTIITCSASKELQSIHDRMPVIFETEEQADLWMNCEDVPSEKALNVLKPFKEPREKSQLEFYEVSPVVNSVKNNSSDCTKPLAEAKKGGIMSYFTKSETKPKTESVKVKAEEVDEDDAELPELEEHEELIDANNISFSDEERSFEEKRAEKLESQQHKRTKEDKKSTKSKKQKTKH